MEGDKDFTTIRLKVSTKTSLSNFRDKLEKENIGSFSLDSALVYLLHKEGF